MIEYNQAEQDEFSDTPSVGIKVIGIGGAGSNVLDRMALEGSDEAELLTLNTDIRALSTSVSTEKIQLGATLLKGMGTGGDPTLGKQAALEAVDQIRAAVRSSKMLFICVGLGGGTGSGAAPEVCRIAREEGVFLVVFATMPFTFEGTRRTEQASDALNTISRYANAVITFDNDRMGELIVAKDGVAQAFAAADRIISQSIRATMNVVFRPGIIRIGMDDLLSALDAEDSRCLFGYGMAKGDNRSHEALEQALKCPLLDRGKLLNDARSVLVQVAGGDSMTLFEVQLVMEEVAKHVGPSTQILFGTGTDKRLGSNLTVTIISSIAGPGVGQSHTSEPEIQEQVPTISLGMLENPIGLEEGLPSLSGATFAEELDYPEAVDYSVENVETEQVYVESSYEEGASVFEPLEEMEGIAEEEGERPAYAPEPLPILHRHGADVQDLNEPEPVNPIARALGAAPEGHSVPPPIPSMNVESTTKVEAVTEGARTISLTRMGGSAAQGASKGKPRAKTVVPTSALPPSQPPAIPEEEAPAHSQIYQQQDMLQLEPTGGFPSHPSGSDPNIIDGEDMDIPAFLRRKKE